LSSNRQTPYSAPLGVLSIASRPPTSAQCVDAGFAIAATGERLGASWLGVGNVTDPAGSLAVGAALGAAGLPHAAIKAVSNRQWRSMVQPV
jgi:hypothetical protein